MELLELQPPLRHQCYTKLNFKTLNMHNCIITTVIMLYKELCVYNVLVINWYKGHEN